MRARMIGFVAAAFAVAGLGLGASYADEVKKKDETKKECPEAKGGCDEAKKAGCDEAKKSGCDEAKKSGCDEAKKAGCCDEEKAAAKKSGGCCGDDEKAAKKAKGDCDGCGEPAKAFAKAVTCPACEKSEKGPCDFCKKQVAAGKAVFIPIKGMTCSSCEGAVSKKLEGVEGLGKYMVAHRFGGAALMVAPGKAVKLSDVQKALTGEMAFDETAPIMGGMALLLEGCDKTKEACSDTIKAELKKIGAEAKACGECPQTKMPYVAICAGEKGASLKALREAVAACGGKLADVVFIAPKDEESPKGKS